MPFLSRDPPAVGALLDFYLVFDGGPIPDLSGSVGSRQSRLVAILDMDISYHKQLV
ncbi:hypothetical protein PAHAL_6G131600 [Panicum hallii]|uniref:Uncharacterized protein n=1 Tax=Panicum hallii TaxID=206008 RepID=A0A2T8IG47_9POAL|nr:hypothetical protein PAHAL_6G131600 [Panicum hallii]